MIKRFKKNDNGRDFVVGDIHGCFTKLQRVIDKLGFNPQVDRLFSVGDLVDRGEESELSLEWLDKPWFHAVRGNHEQMAIDAAQGMFDASNYISNGGAWFLGMLQDERTKYADAFSILPIAIEIETDKGLIGIVHAECPVTDWNDLSIALSSDNSESFINLCVWSRDRAKYGITSIIKNIYRVIVGHTPMKSSIMLGNVLYIDTGAVFGHQFTIIQL